MPSSGTSPLPSRGRGTLTRPARVWRRCARATGVFQTRACDALRPCGNIRPCGDCIPSALALLLSVPAAAQQSPADVAITRAFHLLDHRQASAAERLLSPIARDPALPDRQKARAARGLGKAYLDLGRRADASREFARALEAALAASDRGEAGWTRLATGDMHYQDGHVDRARADWELSRSDFVAAGDANGEFEVVDDIENSIPGLERRPYAERCLAIAREQQDPLLEARARERWGGGLLDAGWPVPR